MPAFGKMEIILYIIVALLLIVVVLQFVQLGRRPVDWSPLAAKLEALLDAQERTDRSLRDEMGRARSEARASSQEERTELARTLASF
ncbi:MAG: hypothetical protein GXY72_14895, partial [Deltaproteobacteria bacterium]|nr:hypothetical protein [Deltaproteobacteria bacterium]